jgi:cytoskeleton protein RodZ
VTDPVVNVDAGDTPPVARIGAGDMLRSAREAAGLSIDAVAQQLKLAPRQVKAIEEEDFSHLPGRTFVRGFVRNYARLVRLDMETVLAALPDAAATLEAPSLQAPAADMGELPAPEGTGLGWTRWAIPAAMIAIVAALALYEFLRPAPAPEPRHETPAAAAVDAPAPPSAQTSGAPADTAGTPLANPVTSTATPDLLNAPSSEPVTLPTPSNVAESAAPAVSRAAAAPAPAPARESAPAVKAAASTGHGSVVLVFRDYSWTEIKDRNGVVLMSRMNPGGTTQTIAGDAPIDLVIGNAADVTLTFKGARVDLVPFTRQNVARLTLR